MITVLYRAIRSLFRRQSHPPYLCVDGYFFHRWDEWYDGPLCDWYICGRCGKEQVCSNMTGEGFKPRPSGSPIITRPTSATA